MPESPLTSFSAVRTLSTEDRGYNPLGYHSGTVWPHETSLIAAGLTRYGFRTESNQLALALLDAAKSFDFRLPETFAGHSRSQGKFPVPYPTPCSPQAWATGAPSLIMRAMLGGEARNGEVRIDPHLPDDIGRVLITRLPAFGKRWKPRTTSYGYHITGNLATVTDPAGNVTRYTYNLAGQRIRVEDLDTGTTNSAYNEAGDLLSTTDARGQKISLQYDVLGRPTFQWNGEPSTGTKLVTYGYDGIVGAKGQLSRTTRHVGTANYVTEPTGYDDRYRPTGIQWTIPTAEGNLAGTYRTDYAYDSADHLTSLVYPARAGLPAETVGVGYDDKGFATNLAGLDNYVSATGYSSIGQLASRTYGNPGAGQLVRNYGWDGATGRLARISATLPDPATPGALKTVQDDRYNYLAAGDVSSIKDHTDGQAQCFRYDGLHRLTEAYTALDDCVADPTNVGASGKQPYWDSFAFDNAGRRSADTHKRQSRVVSRRDGYPDG